MCKFSNYFIVLAMILLSSCASQTTMDNNNPATVDNIDPSPVASTTDASDNRESGEELICRREIVTGTNFRRRVCRTRDELEDVERQAQELLDYQRTRTTGN